MRKVLILLSLSFTMMLFVSPVFANEEMRQDKVYLHFQYPDGAPGGVKGLRERLIDAYVIPVLTKNKCDVITDESFFTRLQGKGYFDSISVERADIIDIYKNDGFRYLIFIDMDGIQLGNGYFSYVYIKIIDMENCKYIYSGRRYQMGSGHGSLINRAGQDIAKVIEDRVFAFTPGNADNK